MHVLAALEPLGLGQVVVVASPRKAEIEAEIAASGVEGPVDYAVQEVPRGTADAVRCGVAAIRDGIDHALVLSGDTPLVTTETLRSFLESHLEVSPTASMITATVDDPTGYGRVIRRPDQSIERIVEQKDATEAELAIGEVNMGTYVFALPALRDALPQVSADNAQDEYYLPDVISILGAGSTVASFEAPPEESHGVNSRSQLAEAGRLLRERAVRHWMEEGVTIVDPATTHIDAGVTIEPDATILPFTFIEGQSKVGAGASVGPQVRIVDSVIGPGAEVSFAVVRGSDIGEEAIVGPFASLRPGTRLGRRSRIGTFVETKQTTIADDSKANHLAYLGDATIGSGVNVGAGTITCNWDGQTKHATIIDDDAYIGSDTMLVAPTHIGRRAATGAGSVVRGDVPDDSLAVGVPARVIEGKGNKMAKPRRDDGPQTRG